MKLISDNIKDQSPLHHQSPPLSSSRCCSPPIRWIICILGIYATGLLFAQRSAMSVAVVAMTSVSIESLSIKANKNNFDSVSHHHCETAVERIQFFSTKNFTINQIDTKDDPESVPEFDWNEKVQGLVLGSAFYLYFVSPTFAGRLTDFFGGKWITFVGIAGPAILCTITPFVTRTFGVGCLIAVQTLIGGFHGCLYPSLFALNMKWFPPEERAIANGGIILGGTIGTTIMSLISGYLCETRIGWPLVFYTLGVMHLPWLAFWLYFASSDPKFSKRIGDRELKYIQEYIGMPLPPTATTTTTTTPTDTDLPQPPPPSPSPPTRPKAPWLAIVTSLTVWCSIVTKMSAAFGYFLLLTKIPSFLSTIYGVTLMQNGVYTAISTSAAAISSLFASSLANFFIRHMPRKFRSIWIRKIFQCICGVGPAVCLVLITINECNLNATIVCIFFAFFCYGFISAGEFTVISDYAPNFVGTVFGFCHLLPFLMGVIAPYIVGVILDQNTGGDGDPGANLNRQWNIVFYMTAAVFVTGATVFAIGGTDQQQEWDKLDYEEKKKQNKQDKNNSNSNSNYSNDSKNLKNDSKNFEQLTTCNSSSTIATSTSTTTSTSSSSSSSSSAPPPSPSTPSLVLNGFNVKRLFNEKENSSPTVVVVMEKKEEEEEVVDIDHNNNNVTNVTNGHDHDDDHKIQYPDQQYPSNNNDDDDDDDQDNDSQSKQQKISTLL